jgi:hypothetical protein
VKTVRNSGYLGRVLGLIYGSIRSTTNCEQDIFNEGPKESPSVANNRLLNANLRMYFPFILMTGIDANVNVEGVLYSDGTKGRVPTSKDIGKCLGIN